MSPARTHYNTGSHRVPCGRVASAVLATPHAEAVSCEVCRGTSLYLVAVDNNPPPMPPEPDHPSRPEHRRRLVEALLEPGRPTTAAVVAAVCDVSDRQARNLLKQAGARYSAKTRTWGRT